ncbi:SPOR domain-containing protein [Dyella sp.]|uniref:SPOR domain-containing protein n=1 Tax=Dyella sp. TaxID=1869338 RepID=UPI002D7915BC|nr:SPOR domain-containing protein [Dyella sp.]HET6433903.1 SPOR domain-containing protein [Dyella sp.]
MKTRLLGAAVLIAFLVLFVPMFFPSSPPTAVGDQSVSLAIPPAPDRDLQTKTMSLDPDAATPAAPASAGAVVIPAAAGGSSDALATVDIRSRRPTDVETGDRAPGEDAPVASNPPAVQAPEPATAKPAPAEPEPAKPAPAKPAASEPVIKSTPPAEAPKADAPATPPATAARGSHTLNLSAYASSAGARSLVQRVQGLGYPVSSRVIQQGGKALTAVTAGPFSSRAAAESARLKITQSIAGVPVRLESHASTPDSDAPAAASTGSARSAGGWAVQVAAMSSQSDALALRDRLRANGFDGFVDTVTAGGRKLWRVRAGPQTQRDDAQRVRDQIKSKLGLAGNVVSVP